MISVLKIFSFITILQLFQLSYLFAHGESNDSGIPFEKVYASVLEKASSLDFVEAEPESQRFKIFLSGPKKYVYLGERSFLVINNAFWDLADQIFKLYVAEIESACKECVLPDLNVINLEAKSLVAKGWVQENSKKLKEILAYRYAGAFVTLGGRYGPASGVIKLIGELMEEALLIVFKLPGAHMLCEVITAVIAFCAGKTNTVLRSFSYSKYSNLSFLSSPRALARIIATSLTVRKAFDRMAIGYESIEINPDELKEFVDHESETKLTYKITGRHRVKKFLDLLQIKTIKGRVDSKKLKLSDLETQEMNSIYRSQINGFFKVIRRKAYEGRRYGLTFYLKKRKQKDSLGEFADESTKVVSNSRFWILGLKNDILDPLTSPSESSSVEVSLSSNLVSNLSPESSVKELIETLTSDSKQHTNQDSVTQMQIEDYPSLDQDFILKIFKSLDSVVEYEKSSMTTRRTQLAFLQSYLSGVMPKLITNMVEAVLEQFEPDQKSLISVYRLYYKVGQIYYHAEQFTDFLRFASVAKSSNDPFLKYHIRDYFKLINETLTLVADFEASRTSKDLSQFTDAINAKVYELKTQRFWIEKRSQIGFLPKLISVPLDLVFHPIKNSEDFIHYLFDLKDFGWVGSSKPESQRARFKKPKLVLGAPLCESLYL